MRFLAIEREGVAIAINDCNSSPGGAAAARRAAGGGGAGAGGGGGAYFDRVQRFNSGRATPKEGVAVSRVSLTSFQDYGTFVSEGLKHWIIQQRIHLSCSLFDGSFVYNSNRFLLGLGVDANIVKCIPIGLMYTF